MADATAGKQRSAGVDLLLFVVTLGVYWWVWLAKSFGEVARSRNVDLGARKFIPLLVALWLAVLAVAGTMAATMISAAVNRASSSTTPPAFNPLEVWQKNLPVAIAWVLLTLAFYGVQLVYLRKATTMVADATRGLGGPGARPPSPALAVAFCALFAFGWVPFLGSLGNLAALIIAIIWVVQVQGAMNGYWQTRQPAMPLPPMGFRPGPA